jgi:hypothetical protein
MVIAVLPWRFGVLMIEKTIYLFEKDAQNARRGALCVFCPAAGMDFLDFFKKRERTERFFHV